MYISFCSYRAGQGLAILKPFGLNHELISLLDSSERVLLLVTLEKCLQTGN